MSLATHGFKGRRKKEAVRELLGFYRHRSKKIEVGAGIGHGSLGAVCHWDPTNNYHEPVPFIFCLGDNQMPLALGTREMLGFCVL